MFLLKEFEGTASAVLDASPDEVFAVITDVDRLPEWNDRIHHVIERPDGVLGPDAEWVVEMRALGSKWSSRATVTEYDAGRRVFGHVSRTDDGNPSSVGWRWEVSPVDNGQSRVDVSWRVNPRTFWRQALFAKIRRNQLGDELPNSLAALGRVAAADRPAPGVQ